MKFLIVFAAVLVTAKAGQIPIEATVHQPLVPVPANDLVPPLPENVTTVEQAAVVKEVSKEHLHKPAITEQPVTVQPEEEQKDITTIMPTTPKQTITETTRQTRAVPYTDNEAMKPQLATDVNVIKNILNQRKTQKVLTNIPSRSMRSVEQEIVMMVTPETVALKTSADTATTKKPSPPPLMNPCDLLCTKFEFDPICATNGLCLHEFPNQCILDTYNCKNPSQKFSATKDDRCQMHWLTKCNEQDMI